MPQSNIQVWIHVVWTTRKRLPLLEKSWRGRLFAHIKEVAQTKNYHIASMNGVEDHVHLLLRLKAAQSLAQIVKNIKGEASRWINANGLMPDELRFRWQDGYAAFSVSPDRVPQVRRYIERQEAHHQQHTLEDENFDLK